MSDLSNLYSSRPAVLSIVKAFGIHQLDAMRDVDDLQNVATFGRNCLGSPIQIRCSTNFYDDVVSKNTWKIHASYLWEQERPRCALQELDQPPQP